MARVRTEAGEGSKCHIVTCLISDLSLGLHLSYLLSTSKVRYWDFPGDSAVKTLHAPNAGGLDSIPGQGARSRMLQLRPSTAK